MAILRNGIYGTYYGSRYSESNGLTETQQKMNAEYILSYLWDKGWTINAIAGILGNMEAESSINPGRWQSELVGNGSGGYGLVQWTPATKYLDWCDSNGYTDPSEMDNNLARIIYELENNIQWIATDEYPLSFKDFSTSTNTPSYLASAFLKCYERAGVEVESTRRANANKWYTYISGEEPSEGDTPSTSKKKKKRFKFVLFNRQRGVLFK